MIGIWGIIAWTLRMFFYNTLSFYNLLAMHHIEMYTKPDCVYCIKAKWHIMTFLKGWQCKEELMTDENKRYIEELYGIDVKTVPQIIIGGVYVGGFSELCTYIENMYP